MNLLHGIPPEVYSAYFRDTGGRPAEKTLGAVVCAEDPHWEQRAVPRLSKLSVRTLARYNHVVNKSELYSSIHLKTADSSRASQTFVSTYRARTGRSTWTCSAPRSPSG
jgi:hypothetical protein